LKKWRRSPHSFAQSRNGPPALEAAGKTAAATGESRDYGLTAVADAESVVFSAVPTELTAAMMASEMPTTINPYSMAVAPDSLDKKVSSNLFMTNSGLKYTPPFPFIFFFFERRIIGRHALKKWPSRVQLLSKV
jgi:hypothetical protein